MARPRCSQPQPRWRAAGSIADPRIDHRVQKVDPQIDEHVDEAEQQHDALNDRIVAPQDGIEREAAKSWNREYAFGDDSTADQQRNADSDNSDNGNGRILQRMNEQNRALRQALSPRGADV